MLSKLLELTEYEINIILDDSGSMLNNTDSCKTDAGPYMQMYLRDGPMTRWEEQEDRVHILVDFVSCIPTKKFTIRFLNRRDKIEINRDNEPLSPEAFADKVHKELRTICSKGPSGSTPTYEVLTGCLANNEGPTMTYLFTDGEPNGGPAKVAELIMNRKNPKLNPLTLVTCSNNDDDVKWMKDIEEQGPFVSETDDFKDEKAEVLHDQGPAFPYTRGLWLLCLLVGAINPYDLDALDDRDPLSKFTMDNILGRSLTDEEYRKYWDNHPNHASLESSFKKMSLEKKPTAGIIGKSKFDAIGKIKKRLGFF